MTIIWVRVDESRFLMKHQINYHQVFIRNEICFSSQAKYFLFYCFVWEDLSKKGVRASSRVPNTYGLVLLSVFRSLEPVRKHLPQFLTYFIKHKFVIHCFMVCCHWNSWFLIIFFFGGGGRGYSKSLVKLCGIRRFTPRCFLFFTAAHNFSKTATTQLNH